jgi:hypothetical protein
MLQATAYGQLYCSSKNSARGKTALVVVATATNLTRWC